MTPEQIRLARHALGLPNNYRRSYRNRFCANNRSGDYAEWRAMTDAGMALRLPWGWNGGDFFCLTRAGAEAVLQRGEKLDPEDFPTMAEAG